MTPPRKLTDRIESDRFCHSTFHLKSNKSMKYDISKKSAPAMPTLGKGTECIKILLSQTSKDMHEPLVPMLFPILPVEQSSGVENETAYQRPRNGVSKGTKRRIENNHTALAFTGKPVR